VNAIDDFMSELHCLNPRDLVRSVHGTDTQANEMPGAPARNVAVVFAELQHPNTLARVQHDREQSGGMAHVLRRCVADKLHFQLEVLTNVIERLGGARGGELAPNVAVKHGRTVRAVEARLERLGLLGAT
jgi:hypothetical protein